MINFHLDWLIDLRLFLASHVAYRIALGFMMIIIIKMVKIIRTIKMMWGHTIYKHVILAKSNDKSEELASDAADGTKE